MEGWFFGAIPFGKHLLIRFVNYPLKRQEEEVLREMLLEDCIYKCIKRGLLRLWDNLKERKNGKMQIKPSFFYRDNGNYIQSPLSPSKHHRIPQKNGGKMILVFADLWSLPKH
jgi:hypothetical protein